MTARGELRYLYTAAGRNLQFFSAPRSGRSSGRFGSMSGAPSIDCIRSLSVSTLPLAQLETSFEGSAATPLPHSQSPPPPTHTAAQSAA